PPQQQTGFPAYMTERVKEVSIEYILKKYIYSIFPASEANGSFQWDDLYDPKGRKGEDRFDAQYWHVNVDPWERYTLSLIGSSAYRLGADESGYRNLFFTGDWTNNGLNVGCIEACVISGMRCAA